MFKKSDYIIISIICFFLGVFIISQYYAGKEYNKLTQPENNEVLAVEVAKLTKANANLRREAQDLTINLDSYKNTSESSKKIYDQYLSDSKRLDTINGVSKVSGQGVVINVDGKLSTPEIVDIVNAIRNIGGEIIEINGQRLAINTSLDQYSGKENYQIEVLGNSSILKSSMERKGGIIDQIQNKDLNFSIIESSNIEIPTSSEIKFKYAKIID